MIFQFLLVSSIILLSAFGLEQGTECKDLDDSSALSSYEIWSLNHIQTWCKDHDPSSTGQCASFTWPANIQHPTYRKLHRNWYEWLMTMQPKIGTRSDCISRSAALNINTNANRAGLVEAVTCDVYDFGRHRRNECVCFPIYADHVTQDYVFHENAEILHTTTSVFYPPPQVVQSVLLAAAREGAPFARPASVIGREPRTLGGFPYCPTPAPSPKPGLVPRTVVEKVSTKRHGKKKTPTTTFPNLPTQYPKCDNVTFYKTRKPSACALDRCMWDFIQNFTSTSSNRITYTDASGVAHSSGWITTMIPVTTKHWGILPPLSVRNGTHKRPADTVFGQNDAHKAKCHNETDCWHYCEREQKEMMTQMYILIAIAAIVTAIAVIGMIWVAYCKRRTKTTEVAESNREQGPMGQVTEMSREPERASRIGTLRRAAEEGRSGSRVGSPSEHQEGPPLEHQGHPARDGVSADVVRKVSGRDAKFEVSRRGSIRNRVPSTKESRE